ncbi:hypothetical protein M0802_015860, partial [Mischocyttarus mexicanus]
MFTFTTRVNQQTRSAS